MNLIYEDNFDEVVTFESYFKGYILKDNNVLMPYINIGVSEHALNVSKNLLHLDYSFVVCIDVALMKYNGKIIYDEILGKFGSYQIVYLGGTDLEIGANVEYQVICRKAFLQITEKTKSSNEFWVPTNTTNFNMNQKEVRDFFSLKDLPENLHKLFC